VTTIGEVSQEGWGSQNHRTVEVGRDLRRSSGPTPLLKQGHLEQAAQACVQAAFEYLQGDRLSFGCSFSLTPSPILSAS